ncbi:hypothetical protein, partial [Bradyrhizobium valentinum]|uniref:hypothetical protein n=1 Tax=Bradyrhizobium valentinum TaxID=1518501 RepID=UPI001AED06FB
MALPDLLHGKKWKKRPGGALINFSVPLQVCGVCKIRRGRVPALENCKGDPSMSMLSSAVQRSTLGLHTLEQYEP